MKSPQISRSLPTVRRGLLFFLMLLAGSLQLLAQPINQYLIGQNAWQPPWFFNGRMNEFWGKMGEAKFQTIRIGGNEALNDNKDLGKMIPVINSIRGAGAEVILQVPDDFSRQQAIDYITAVNVTNGKHIKLWSIGNEYANNHGKVRDSAHVADYIRRISSGLKSVDPTIIVMGPEEADFTTGDVDTYLGGGNDISGKDAAGNYYLDVYTWHTYNFNDTNGTAANVAYTVAKIATVNANRPAGKKLYWGIGEINTHWDMDQAAADQKTWTFHAGQMFAELYDIGMRNNAFSICPWSMIENGGSRAGTDLGEFDADSSPRATYYHTLMLAQNMRLNYLASTSNQTGVKLIPMGDATGVAVMILNETATNFNFSLKLDTGAVTASPLQLKVAAGINAEIPGTIAGKSTQMLVICPNGTLIKKYTYTEANTNAKQPPTVQVLGVCQTCTNAPPTIDPMLDRDYDAGIGLQSVGFSGVSDGDSCTQGVTITATSSNPAVAAVGSVNYTSCNAAGSVWINPLTKGTATITVTVTDGGAVDCGPAAKSVSFTVSVGQTTTLPAKIEAEDFTTMQGIQVEPTTDVGGGFDVGYTDVTDFMNYAVNVPVAGTYAVDFRIASNVFTGQIQLRDQVGTPLATVSYTAADNLNPGWQNWTTKTVNAVLPAGKQTLQIYYSGAGLNLNWFEVKGAVPPVITSAATAAGQVGSAFSYQIVASNTPTSFSATGLPAGLSVNATTGLISGTPTAAATSSITLGATNASGTGNKVLALTIAAQPAPVITSATVASGQVGSAFSYQIAATNVPTSYSATGLPAGLTVNAAGLISGTPTAAGVTPITLGATNAGGTGSATLTLTVTNGIAALAIDVGGPAAGSFAADAFFVGGTIANHPNAISTAGVTNPAPVVVYQNERWGPSTYTIPGFTANGAYLVRLHFAETWFTGAAGQGAAGAGLRQFNVSINGAPVLTNFDITVAAGGANKAVVKEFNTTANALGQIIVQMATGLKDNATINGIEIIASGPPPAPVISSAGAATGQVASAFTYQITASNTPTSFSATGLPAGLSVNATTGLISGTPTTAAVSVITLSATNAGGTGTKALTLTVNAIPVPVITSAATATGQVGSAFSYQITAANNPTSYSATGLPAGLTLNAAGLISGTPTAAGVSTVALGATNPGGTGSLDLTLTIAAIPAPVITSAATATGQVGAAFSYQIVATNNPTSFSATGLPLGLTVNAAGLISGTPTAAGVSAIALGATNAGGAGSKVLTLTVNAIPVPVITSALTATGKVGTAFTYQITATNNPTSFSATNLPAGLTVNAAGLISGTPTVGGTSSIALGATNAGGTGSATLALTVTTGPIFAIDAGGPAAAPFVADANFVGGTAANHPNAIDLSGATNPAPLVVYQNERWGNSTYTFPGLTAGASYLVRLHFAETWFTGAAGQGAAGAGLRQFNVAINGAPALTNFDITAAAGAANKAVVKEFTLPANAAGQIIVALTAGLKDNATINGLEIYAAGPPPAPVISSAATATAQVASPFNYQITASNTPTSFNALGLPAGLSVNAATGLISGTPTAAAISSVTLSATNAGGTGTKVLTLTVNTQPVPVITSAATASGQVGAAFTYQITASNTPTTFNAIGLPAGLTVNPATGLISGTPTAAAITAITLSATNGGGTGTLVLTLTVNVIPAPVISSAATASGQVGSAFSYQITASNTPTSFGATGLPAGLSVNAATGLISGTPSAAAISTITLSATNAGGTGTKVLTLTVTNGLSSFAVHAGPDVAGQTYGAYVADTAIAVGGTVTTHANAITTTGVTNPAPVAVYQAERYGNSTYTISGLGANSSYIVRLHFAETYYTGAAGQGAAGAGKRQFNVSINAQNVLTNFDIYAAAGGANKAIVKEFNSTSSAAGQTTIQFLAGAIDSAKIDGIELVAGVLTQVLTTIEVTPSPVAMNPNDSKQFTAVGKDQNGGVMPITPVWSATGGTVTQGGMYTAGAASGTFAVTASVGGISGSAQALVGSGQHLTGVVSQYGQLKLVGGRLSDKNGVAIQLSGMSAHQLQFYPWTANTVTNLVEQYGNSLVRAAMYINEQGYLTDPVGMKAKTKLIMDAAIANDVYVLCDWHGVGGNPNDNVNEAKAFFQEMSAAYAAYPNVIYEIYNEPNVDWATIKTYANQVIPIIRANAPNSIIVVGTPNMSSNVGVVQGNTLAFPNIMYTMHFYCGNATVEADNPGARATASNLIANGIAVFVTEWGASNWTGDGGPYPVTAQNYLNWMATEKISWANWSLVVKNEGSAFLKPTASMSGPWNDSDLTADGLFLKNKFVKIPTAAPALTTALNKSYTGFVFTEGPATDALGNTYFSDQNGNKVYKIDASGVQSLFLDNTQGMNGLMFDGQGKLIGCQGDAGRVVSINTTTKVITPIASTFNGIRFNRPNDLVIDSVGGIYFTDPVFGQAQPQPVMGVYYIAPGGAVTRVIANLNQPNGIMLSRDGSTLYVTAGTVQQYPVTAPGVLGAGTLFANLNTTGADGMSMDTEGNLYVTPYNTNTVRVLSPTGTTLATFAVPEVPTNVEFGGVNRDTLFVTAGGSVYTAKINKTGFRFMANVP